MKGSGAKYKMRVLFLDIDGVCNSRAWAEKGNSLWNGTDPDAVALVRKIIKETKCTVVLSSTWRLYPDSRAAVKRDVCHYYDVTKDMQAGAKRGIVERGLEVQEWLDRHPEVTQYAILDDESDFLPNQWLFKTTFAKGITEEIAQSVIDHLTADSRYFVQKSV